MSAEDRDIERLIVRHLDGALGADEELELNRAILRDPDAHRLLEEYRRIDELSTAVLDQVVPAKETVVAPATGQRHYEPGRPGRSHLLWWLLPGAMAAALTVAVVHGPGVIPQAAQQSADRSWAKLPETAPAPVFTNGLNGAAQRRVSDRTPRRRVTRDIYRDVFGVVGQDGNIYWIEVDRTRTIKRPNSRSSRSRSDGEL